MDPLKKKFQEKFSILKSELKSLTKENGDLVVEDVKLNQVLGGARDIKMMLWETSSLDANEGIRFRGYSIPQLRKKLPKGKGKEPLPEGLFWLMLVGEIPKEKEVKWLSNELKRRAKLPKYTVKILNALPADTHPMTQFAIAINSLQNDSIFAAKYEEGMSKDDYWDATYEDSLNLIAKLPLVAAYIYRKTYFNGKHIKPDKSLDWAANFAHMLGYENADFQNLMRLYLTIHADHEGGNASAHTVHLVGSTLSDVYLSLAAGINALAGPLHGLANQECIKWIFEMVEELGTRKPTKEQIAEYVKSTITAGRVVPGYGHAVLRVPDPRFIAQKEFAQEYIKQDDIVEIVWKVFEVVPPILQSLGKVSNPWPNVDAHSGSLLVHYGMTQYNFYTVLFGVSRGLGVLAATCWLRALGMPLERPKSVTSDWVKTFIKSNQNA